jgi:hypothetical protein
MKLKDVKDVLTFAAFRPEPDDSTAPWSKRFPRQRSLLLNLNRDGVTWRGVEKGGVLGEAGNLDGTDLKELVTDMAEEWKSLTEDGWCGVSINNRYVISLENNLTRKKGCEELIRTNPKAALGSKAERGKRYSVKHNPESNSSLLLAVDEEFVKQIETVFDGAGLKVGRISCGIFGMLSDAIDQMAEAREQYLKSNPTEPLGKIVIVACCEGSVAVLSTSDENWLELRSRSGLYAQDDLEPVLKIIMPLVENAGTGAQLVFTSDAGGAAVKELLTSTLPNTRISDISQGDGLWTLLKEK